MTSQPSSPAPATAGETGVDLDDRRPRRWGWWLLLAGFGGFLAWALLAPLDAGVSAAGTVVVTGNRKAVQPMASGMIAAVMARDGDSVRTGQLLVRLDSTQSRSQFDIARGQWFSALATEARLVAERTASGRIDFPQALRDAHDDPRAAAAMALQTQLLATRRQTLRSELASMNETLLGLELQLRGLEGSSKAKQEQLALLREDLANQRSLVSEGFLPRNRMLDQERAVAAMVGAIAEDTGSIGRNQQAIAEIKTRMLTREQEIRKEVESQLADVQRESSSLRSRLQALEFDLANTEIKSPADGIVLGLSVHTVGGVVGAGVSMMEIVPANEMLRVEAQIAPHLIDKVHPGLAVDVLFTAFNQANTPHIPGRVSQVSADVLTDPRQNGLPYFKATIDTAPEGLAQLRGHAIRAGMPAEVFIRTGERTAMNYLLKPMLDRLNHALTEP